MAHPRQLEVGVADVFLPHEKAVAAPRPPAPAWLARYEARRPRWLMEAIAEFIGVFLFCFLGEVAAVWLYLANANNLDVPLLGGILNVAFAFAIAVASAITLIAPTSGGHLSPAFTILFAMFKGFPWAKVPLYIIAQLLGAWIGSLAAYACNAPALSAISNKMIAAGKFDEIFTNEGPASTLAIYLAPSDPKLGIVFVNELLSTMVIALMVFSVLDPSNVFVAPTAAGAHIGIIFFAIVFCFGPNGVSLNTARDLGSRFAVACIWKTGKAFPAKHTAMAAFGNIVGSALGAIIQILFLADSVRPPTEAALSLHSHKLEHDRAHEARMQELGPTLSNGFLTRTATGLSQKIRSPKSGFHPTLSKTSNEHLEYAQSNSPVHHVGHMDTPRYTGAEGVSSTAAMSDKSAV